MSEETEKLGYTTVKFTEWEHGSSTAVVPVSWPIKIDGRLICYYPQ